MGKKSNTSLKRRFLDRVDGMWHESGGSLDFLGIAIRLYRRFQSTGTNIKGKLAILKQKIVRIMLDEDLVKFVSARTEAKLIYELKLPDDDAGDKLGGSLIRLLYEHGATEGLTDEEIQHLIISKSVSTTKHELTDKCKKLLRSDPELWVKTRKLLALKPKLEVGEVTKKTRAGGQV